jgi:hypothetical protein
MNNSNEKYRYRLSNTLCNSERFGDCEVCKKRVAEVFIQSELGEYKPESWCYLSGPLFGHESCLRSQRKNGVILSEAKDKHQRLITTVQSSGKLI